MQLILVAFFACSPVAEQQPLSSPDQPQSVPVCTDALRLDAPVRLAVHGHTTLEEYRWSFQEQEGWAWVARLPRDASVTIEPSAHVKPLAEFSELREGEVLINGGFYDNGPMGLVVHEGKQVAPLSTDGGSGVLYWSAASGTRVVHRDHWAEQGTEALQSIDRLVDQGKSLVRKRADAEPAARAAIALSSEHVLGVVVSTNDPNLSTSPFHRNGAQESEGLPLWAFADMLVSLGAEQALNMDGGISVEMRARVGGQDFTLSGGPGTINAVRLSRPEPRPPP